MQFQGVCNTPLQMWCVGCGMRGQMFPPPTVGAQCLRPQYLRPQYLHPQYMIQNTPLIKPDSANPLSTTSLQLTRLETEWQKLFLPFPGNPTLIEEIFSQLVTAYSSKERYYHNLLHIQQILNIINTLEPLTYNLPAIQMAAWFHDIVYDPKSPNNEEKSAEYASASLSKLEIPLTIINKVVKIILNTKNHQASPEDIDSHILLDADLSILGAKQSEYITYTQAIRQEYSWVTEAEYKLKRKRILQHFLQRDRIYLTHTAFEMLEIKAKTNIRNEILKLSLV